VNLVSLLQICFFIVLHFFFFKVLEFEIRAYTLSHSTSAGITEVLDPKGLRAGTNKTRQDTYWEGQQVDDQLAKFYFSQSALYKKGRDLNIKNTLTQLKPFCVFHPAFLLPLSLTKYKLLFRQGNNLAFLPTVIEAWCTCRFQPCRNAAKPQWPY
jgi:hypothetical protein